MNCSYGVLLGGNCLNRGIIDRYKEYGLKCIVIDWNESPALLGDLHLQIDVKDYISICQQLDNLKINDVKICYTSIDLATKTLNQINKKFNHLHTDEFFLNNSIEKNKMNKIWQEKNLFNRYSELFSSFDENKILNLQKKYKLIVKPNIASSSRGITVIDSNNINIKDAYNTASKISLDNNVLIEEFIEGTEYTVEMIGDNFGNVSVYGISKKYHTKNTTNNKIAIKLHYNSPDTPELLHQNIAAFGIECYRSLGLKNSLGHLEMIVKKDGSFTPVEIGARSSGFIASHLVDIVSERNFLDDYISVINGSKIKNGLIMKKNFSSMYYFYDIPKNSISIKTTNLMKYISNDIQSIYNDRQKLIAGVRFQEINNDNERFGYEILKGKKSKLTIDEVLKAERNFLKDFVSIND